MPPQLAVQVSLALDQCETQYGTAVSAGFWSSQTFGGRGFGCLLAVLPSPLSQAFGLTQFYSRLEGAPMWGPQRRSAHMCVLPRGNPLTCSWWWRWQAHIAPSLWLLLAVHAPIISSSTLAEPDRSIAKTHSQRRAKAARPASFQYAESHWVTWCKGRWDIKTKNVFFTVSKVWRAEMYYVRSNLLTTDVNRAGLREKNLDQSIMDVFSAMSHQRHVELSANKCWTVRL